VSEFPFVWWRFFWVFMPAFFFCPFFPDSFVNSIPVFLEAGSWAFDQAVRYGFSSGLFSSSLSVKRRLVRRG